MRKTKQEDWRLDVVAIMAKNEADAAHMNIMACYNSFESCYSMTQWLTCFQGLSKGSPVSADIAVSRIYAAQKPESLR
jgi:hypothetical protein